MWQMIGAVSFHAVSPCSLSWAPMAAPRPMNSSTVRIFSVAYAAPLATLADLVPV